MLSVSYGTDVIKLNEIEIDVELMILIDDFTGKRRKEGRPSARKGVGALIVHSVPTLTEYPSSQ